MPALLALLVWAGQVAAQEPPPRPDPDTVPADTVPADTVPPDTLPPGVAPDTVPEPEPEAEPPAVFPRVPVPAPGWSDGVWVWDRDALLATAALTLNDLLERLPGIVPVRSGFNPLAEAPSSMGATAGRIEIFLDGYALDPLVHGAFDLARFELMHLRSVRVERRLDGLRIDMETIAPEDPRPFTMVEAGTGDLATNLFRGLFLAPRLIGGSLSLGIERLSSEGLGRVEPGNNFTGWAKWAYVRGATGLELELRQNNLDRRAATPWPVNASRRDLILRFRSAPVQGLSLEALAGRSTEVLELPADTAEPASRQLGARAVYRAGVGDAADARLEAGIRHRDAAGLPNLEVRLGAAGRLGAIAGLSAELTRQTWEGTDAAVAYHARFELGPVLGLRPFAALAGGKRGVPNWTPVADDPPGSQESWTGSVAEAETNGSDAPAQQVPTPLTDRQGWRAGVELSRGRLYAGVAALHLRTDSVPVFGLPFDSPSRLFPGGTVNGWEATARIPLILQGLSLDLSYQEWYDGDFWIYLPPRTSRVALAYHGFPLDTRNLEVFGRLEAAHRSEMLVPQPEGAVAVPGGTLLDFYLQVRIVDVRVFIRFENILHNLEFFDLPGRADPGNRTIYGVKWHFWN